MHEDLRNEYEVLIAKKAEKLVTAVYLVTGIMADHEPIKANLRKLSITMLSSLNAMAQIEVRDILLEYTTSLRLATEIVSLLHVARATGVVSQMNATILMDGLMSLQTVLKKKQLALSEDMFVIENEKSLQETTSFAFPAVKTSYDISKPYLLSDESNRVQQASSYKGQILETGKKEKENVFYKGQQVVSRAVSPSPHTRKDSRREQILSLFVTGVDVSIKDIASRIKGCSEKTIQRELNALVYENAIVRIGEKRWSRYMLR